MFWDILLDSLLDALKVLPFILVIYLVIEWIESNATNTQKVTRLLQKPTAPIFSALLGVVPQCGFSCVATNLYNQKYITMGTLLAVYISTSDEALPILLGNAVSQPESLNYLWKVVLIKLAYALIVGFAVNLVLKFVAVRQKRLVLSNSNANTTTTQNADNIIKTETADTQTPDTLVIVDDTHTTDNKTMHDQTVAHHHNTKGCCNHEIDKNTTFWGFVKHPLIHTAKIFAYLFIINVALGAIIQLWIGEENLAAFMSKALFAQPFVVGAVGLIPNCAASVIITQLMLDGAISFGGAMAGLCCNAGVGLALLFSDKGNLKNNLIILIVLYLSSSILGVIISLF